MSEGLKQPTDVEKSAKNFPVIACFEDVSDIAAKLARTGGYCVVFEARTKIDPLVRSAGAKTKRVFPMFMMQRTFQASASNGFVASHHF